MIFDACAARSDLAPTNSIFAQLGLDFKSLKIVEVHAAGMLPCLAVAVVSFVAALSRSFRDQLRDVFEFLHAAC